MKAPSEVSISFMSNGAVVRHHPRTRPAHLAIVNWSHESLAFLQRVMLHMRAFTGRFR
jgi:hypothetical protein